MGVIQNNINAAMGALSGALVAGAHIAGQSEANKLAKEKEINAAEREYNKNTDKEFTEYLAETGDIDSLDASNEEKEKAVDTYLRVKLSSSANDARNMAEFGNSEDYQKALAAFKTVQDKIQTRKLLKFDLEKIRGGK